MHNNKTLFYIKHALYRLDKTKIVFKNHWPINVKLFYPTFNFLKFHIITHFVQYIWDYGSVINYSITYSKIAHKYLLEVQSYYICILLRYCWHLSFVFCLISMYLSFILCSISTCFLSYLFYVLFILYLIYSVSHLCLIIYLFCILSLDHVSTLSPLRPYLKFQIMF